MSAFSYHGGNPSLRYMCFRLYTHALLRESQIFPNVELCDEFPDCTPDGFADTWKGNSDGELVSIKAIRTQDPIRLREVEKVCGLFLLSEANSLCWIPDLPSRNQRVQAHFASKRTPRHGGFRDIVSVLHHEFMDARWKYRPVCMDESGC
jgi:uncharacterized protein Usg